MVFFLYLSWSNSSGSPLSGRRAGRKRKMSCLGMGLLRTSPVSITGFWGNLFWDKPAYTTSWAIPELFPFWHCDLIHQRWKVGGPVESPFLGHKTEFWNLVAYQSWVSYLNWFHSGWSLGFSNPQATPGRLIRPWKHCGSCKGPWLLRDLIIDYGRVAEVSGWWIMT